MRYGCPRSQRTMPSCTSSLESASGSRQQAALHRGILFSQSISAPPWKAYLLTWNSCMATAMPRSRYGRRQGDGFDVAAAQLELAGQESQVHVRRQGCLSRPDAHPDALAAGLVGEGKMDREGETAHEGVVQVLAQVGGQDGDAIVRLHL